MSYLAIDLFSGCGGLSVGLKRAGFKIVAAVEYNQHAAKAYSLNHQKTHLFLEDIRDIKIERIRKLLKGRTLHLLAGCPPCQGFSSIRRLNRKEAVLDPRNDLIIEYMRFVRELRPLTLMMENVPAITGYSLFNEAHKELLAMGYKVDTKVVNVANYGVPQRRKRFVMLGSRIGEIEVIPGDSIKRTVRDVIGRLEPTNITKDEVHKIYPKHIQKIYEMVY